MKELGQIDSKKLTARGTDPQDEKFFSKTALDKRSYAQEEIRFLIDRGYPIKPVVKLIGDHYQLSTRQRLALTRGTCTTQNEEIRKGKSLPLEEMKNQTIFIDGFNVIITLEVALSRGIILKGQDNIMRDLAGLRGTYRLIDKTELALALLGKILDDFKVKEVYFYLDAPVSNSGRLKTKILEQSANWKVKVQVEVVNNPDTILSEMEHVVTGDAIILDRCKTCFNLVAYIIENYIPEAWIIYF